MDKITTLFTDGHYYNIREIERGAGIRKLKIYEFLKGSAKFSASEVNAILRFVKKRNYVAKIV